MFDIDAPPSGAPEHNPFFPYPDVEGGDILVASPEIVLVGLSLYIRLKMKAKIPGIDESKFRAIADDAKQNCPVSKALSAVPISLEAELLG